MRATIIVILMAALAGAGCSESEKSGPDQTAEPAPEPQLPPLPSTDTPVMPRAAAGTAGADQSPFITGGNGRRVPPGHSTEITLAGHTTTIPFTQLGALVSRRDTVSFLLVAEPPLDAERIGPNRFPSLSVAWDVPSAEIEHSDGRLDALAGRTFELEEVGLGRVVIRVDGKEYMARRFKLDFDSNINNNIITGSFSGIAGEFQPRKSMSPMGNIEITGKFRAFPGGWANLQGGD